MKMVIDSSGNNLNRPVIINKPPVSAGASAIDLSRKKIIAEEGFDKILRQKQRESEEVRFSKHAQLRLQSRNIALTTLQMKKINEAVSKAQSKGVRDSLVLMDNLALVINIRNRMVITVTDNNELKENVFTNIDGAVIA